MTEPRRSHRIRWANGHETVTRLFDSQARGTACIFCSLSDGSLLPVGRIAGVGHVVAHECCSPGQKLAS